VFLDQVAGTLDAWILWTLPPLSIYILFSGLDDLFIDIVWLYSWIRRVVFRRPRVVLPSAGQLENAPEKRIAIYVPLWKEHRVIGDMLAHNIAGIRYGAYDVFVGAYPNDAPTLAAVREAESRFANVHLAVCPHGGPTSKADCLNWIYQRMLLYEENHHVRYDLVVTHDAEDLIHPESMRWMNWFTDEYQFVQVPVLALATPFWKLTHGIYCDEFAEFQTRDLPVRNILGGFIPSRGVGTAYTREALDALAEASSNRVFEPDCLTEDYENGQRLNLLGFRQLFLPITKRGTFVATREYFPMRSSSAIRQRTRWTTGIALQGWERHGWSGGIRQVYWLWRDRKALIGNPLSLFTNLVCVYGIATQAWDRITPAPWLWNVLAVTLALQAVRTAVRIGCTGRIYGFGFALLAPARSVLANIINATAVYKAVTRYARARYRGEALAWLKTDHAYPSRAALIFEHRLLGEILVTSSYIEREDLEWALATKPDGVKLGQHLVQSGRLTEPELYEALSLQQRLPLAVVNPDDVPRRVTRALPAHIAARWQVLPFRVQAGELHVAGTDIPDDGMELEVRRHTSLEVRFHLITPASYRLLEAKGR
jgi:bacteriophage N4 adsorption protein B